MEVRENRLNKRQSLSKQLYDSGYLWSYRAAGDQAVLPDEELIVNGLSHLELRNTRQSMWRNGLRPFATEIYSLVRRDGELFHRGDRFPEKVPLSGFNC